MKVQFNIILLVLFAALLFGLSGSNTAYAQCRHTASVGLGDSPEGPYTACDYWAKSSYAFTISDGEGGWTQTTTHFQIGTTDNQVDFHARDYSPGNHTDVRWKQTLSLNNHTIWITHSLSTTPDGFTDGTLTVGYFAEDGS